MMSNINSGSSGLIFSLGLVMGISGRTKSGGAFYKRNTLGEINCSSNKNLYLFALLFLIFFTFFFITFFLFLIIFGFLFLAFSFLIFFIFFFLFAFLILLSFRRFIFCFLYCLNWNIFFYRWYLFEIFITYSVTLKLSCRKER